MARPLIAVATLGGTISMAPVDGDGGAVPRFGAAELLGGLGDVPMDVLAETLAGIGFPVTWLQNWSNVYGSAQSTETFSTDDGMALLEVGYVRVWPSRSRRANRFRTPAPAPPSGARGGCRRR